MSRPLTVGTAGHVDHGKTALVRALTGRDTDRLAEEKRRGISIELGFAELDLGGRRLSLIDVPGHERFVRTMIAGASGIDLFLMVIDAAEGVMPQTREHLTVLRALGIERGVIALTKCDLADARALSRTGGQARELLQDAPLIEVSSHSGQGLAELRCALAELAEQVEDRTNLPTDEDPAVLHIDRVFTITGRGTVVTGTLWSGRVRRGECVTVLPGDHLARVREVQVHDRPQETADPGQRVALNLAGLKRDEVHRGDVVAGAGSGLRPTYRLDIEMALLNANSLAEHERVQVHHGTREAPARVVWLDRDLAQIRLEAPLIVGSGDRVVLRGVASADTLGGGRILDAHPRRHGPGPAVDRLRGIRDGEFELGTETVVAKKGAGDVASAARVAGAESAGLDSAPLSELALAALEILRSDRAMPRGWRALAETLAISRAEATVVRNRLIASGDLIQIKPNVCYPTPELEALRERAIAIARSEGSITLAGLRDALGISRKYSRALLEHLDACRVTLRQGDRHVLRGSHRVDQP